MLNIELVSSTVINHFGKLQPDHDLHHVQASELGNGAEKIIEYAGRVCYKSTHRMGTAPSFIQARVREGHEDIIEHGFAAVKLTGTPLRLVQGWKTVSPYLEITQTTNGDFVSGNLRAWLQLLRYPGTGRDVLTTIAPVAPSVFAEYGEFASMPWSDLHVVSGIPITKYVGQAQVTLLGYTMNWGEDPKHSHATFLFDGLSRACTHQLVRHRLGSYSQCSQRYIDLVKGDWQAIIPPAIAENPDALAVMTDFWDIAESKYVELRELGIRKEDARYLLPNACETRMVVSGNIPMWKHFFWQRALDKAAQWEIRQAAQVALELLSPVATTMLDEEMTAYRELVP